MTTVCFRNISGKHEINKRATETNTETTVNSEKENMKISLCFETYVSRKLLQKRLMQIMKVRTIRNYLFSIFHYLRYKTN